MAFCVVTLLFGFFCGCRGFCHRSESDLFLFLIPKTYGPDTNFGHICNVTLTLETWPRVMVMTHTLVLDSKLCGILSRYYLAGRGYDPDTDFGFMCITTLT